MILQTFGSLAVSVQFSVIGIWGVAAVNSVFILRNILLTWREYKQNNGAAKHPDENLLWGVLTLVVLLPVYLVLNPYNVTDLNSFLIWTLPLMASLANVVSIAQDKLTRLKIFMFVSVACWATFDIITGAWTTLIGDSFSMIACLYAVNRIWKNANK